VWCDDFDLDLARILPAAIAITDRIPASVVLRTFGHAADDGTLNHPAVWHTGHGLTAYFTLGAGRPAPLHCVTFDDVVACTFTDAIRDCWCHDYRIVVDGAEVWDGTDVFHRFMQPLLYHYRGWLPLHDLAVRRLEQQVCVSLAGATRRMHQAITKHARVLQPVPKESHEQTPNGDR
jgi:hypothetical protein